MPFGPIPFNKKLGIANGSMPDAAGFANVVLRLTGLIPVYQGSLVHSVKWAFPYSFWDGTGDAVWCEPADVYYGTTGYVRQISGNDTQYAFRSLKDAQTPANALLNTPQGQGHAGNTTNQVYFFGNEPETYSPNVGSANGCIVTLFGARDNIIDSFLSGTFPLPAPNPNFWEADPNNSATLRTKADALAYSFLKVRKELTLNPLYTSRSHTILPPSNINPIELVADPYWLAFYAKVKSGVTTGWASGDPQAGLSLRYHFLTQGIKTSMPPSDKLA